jgi:hypothetical protein
MLVICTASSPELSPSCAEREKIEKNDNIKKRKQDAIHNGQRNLPSLLIFCDLSLY